MNGLAVIYFYRKGDVVVVQESTSLELDTYYLDSNFTFNNLKEFLTDYEINYNGFKKVKFESTNRDSFIDEWNRATVA